MWPNSIVVHRRNSPAVLVRDLAIASLGFRICHSFTNCDRVNCTALGFLSGIGSVVSRTYKLSDWLRIVRAICILLRRAVDHRLWTYGNPVHIPMSIPRFNFIPYTSPLKTTSDNTIVFFLKISHIFIIFFIGWLFVLFF